MASRPKLMLPKRMYREAKSPDGTPGFAMGRGRGRVNMEATLGTSAGLGSEHSSPTSATPPSARQFEPADEQDSCDESDDEVFMLKPSVASGGGGSSFPSTGISVRKSDSADQPEKSSLSETKAKISSSGYCTSAGAASAAPKLTAGMGMSQEEARQKEACQVPVPAKVPSPATKSADATEEAAKCAAQATAEPSLTAQATQAQAVESVGGNCGSDSSIGGSKSDSDGDSDEGDEDELTTTGTRMQNIQRLKNELKASKKAEKTKFCKFVNGKSGCKRNACWFRHVTNEQLLSNIANVTAELNAEMNNHQEYLNLKERAAKGLLVEAASGTCVSSGDVESGGESKQSTQVAEVRDPGLRECGVGTKVGIRASQENLTNLNVKNLTFQMDDESLEAAFEDYGTITSSLIMRNPDGTSKGVGFVCFSSPEEANAASNGMNGKVLEGRPIFVASAEPRRAPRDVEPNAQRVAQDAPEHGWPRWAAARTMAVGFQNKELFGGS